jgi:hypothetical protein
VAQLWEALESTWASIPVELFRHHVESMPRRIVAVLRAKGGATQYECFVPSVYSRLAENGRLTFTNTTNSDYTKDSPYEQLIITTLGHTNKLSSVSSPSHAVNINLFSLCH